MDYVESIVFSPYSLLLSYSSRATCNGRNRPGNHCFCLALNEGKGKILKDSSGNGYDGKFVKKKGWTREGEFGNALAFAGDPGNNVEIPHADSLTLKEWTITAWLKQEQTPEWSVVLVKEPANGLPNCAVDMIRKSRYFQKSPVW